jgi:hypothetical protein
MVDRHHVLFDRAAWRSSDVRRDLREDRWLIPPITRDAHQELHKAVAIVPALDWNTLARVRRDFESTPGDFIRSIGDFCISLEESLRHPRETELQRALGELTIQALEEQIPFIEEGLMWRRRVA